MGKVLFKGLLFAVWAAFAFSPAFSAEKAAASVGGGAVSERDMADWQAAQACYGPGAITSRQAAFMRNLEASILDEVLTNRARRPITAAEYDAEAARIDRETRAPEVLACIKKYFGGDGARYRRVFIRPILAQRYVREFVRGNPAVQAKAYGLRDAVSKEIAAGKAFSAIGRESGVEYSTAVYSVEEDTPSPRASGPFGGWSPFQAEFINAHLRGLGPGEAAGPIEDEAGLRFVRLISAGANDYYFETLYVPKLTTEDYLKSVKKIPCRINDRELRDWIAPLRGNPLLAPAEMAPQAAAH